MSVDNVLDISPINQYVSSASQTAFDYDFPIFEEDNLVVYDNDDIMVLSTDYTVSGEGDDNGGTVTFLSGRTAGHIITIYRDVPIARTTDFAQNGPRRSSDINDELDRITMWMQQLETRVSRAVRLSLLNPQASTELELDESFEDRYLYVNEDRELEPAILTGTTLSQSVFDSFLEDSPPYARTQEEIDAGVTPVNYTYAPGNVFRYIPAVQVTFILARSLGSQNGATVAAGVQLALDLENTPIHFPAGSYQISTMLRLTTSEHTITFEKGAFLYYNDASSPGSYCLKVGVTGVQTGNIICRGLEIVLQTATAKCLHLLNVHNSHWYSTLLNGYQPPSGLAADWQARSNNGLVLEAEPGIDSFFNTFYSLHCSHTVSGVRIVGGGISTQHIFFDFKFYGDSIYGDTDTVAFDVQGAAFSRVYGGYIEAIGAGGVGFRMLAPTGGGTTGAANWKVHDVAFDTVTTAVSFASGTEENKFFGCVLAGATVSDSSAAGSGNYFETINHIINGSVSEANAASKLLHISCRHYTLAEEPVIGLYFANGASSNELLHGGGRSDRNTVTNHQFYTAANNTTTTGTESMRIDHTASAGFTRMQIFDVDNNQLERVSVGAADSGGTGFKVLRIPN